ncbi:MAG: hotdog fold thioesterase [Desulfobacterales bacterium]|nr:hotdog fold thioesterase [Desulfobacterales bacterium]
MTKHLPTKEELTEYLRVAPFHRWLDLSIGEITDDGLEIIMPWRPEIISITNPKQVVHGGILASLIDLTGLYAILSRGVRPAGTAYMHVDYHRQATSGPLSAKAKVLKIGRIISTAEIFVYGPDSTLLASGSGGYPCS